MHIPHTEWIMKTLERNGRRLLITGISLTGVVFLVTGWILSARSVFKNQLFSNIIKKQVNQVWLCPFAIAYRRCGKIFGLNLQFSDRKTATCFSCHHIRNGIPWYEVQF